MPSPEKHPSQDGEDHHWHLDTWWKRWEEKRLAKNAMEEQKFFEFAKVCEEAERYEDMAHAIKKVVKLCTSQRKDLNQDERVLLASAFKHLIDSHLSSWRTLSSAEKEKLGAKEEGQESKLIVEEKAEVVKERKKVEHEIQCICEQMIRLINNFLLPLAADKDALELYRNMKQEYYGYLFQIGAPEDLDALLEPGSRTRLDSYPNRFRLVPLN